MGRTGEALFEGIHGRQDAQLARKSHQTAMAGQTLKVTLGQELVSSPGETFAA